jgi:hypothetical protein
MVSIWFQVIHRVLLISDILKVLHKIQSTSEVFNIWILTFRWFRGPSTNTDSRLIASR